MRKTTIRSDKHLSLWLLAAAICLSSADAQAQSGNTKAGTGALANNTTGHDNTAIGYHALYSNTTGFSNTAMGSDALIFNTTGNYNVATGNTALLYNSTGSYNTADGYQALYFNTTGNYNVATGAEALFQNSTGHDNTANGPLALRQTTTGVWNTASGSGALRNNTTGNYNTASGGQALFSNTTGSNNVAVGANALGALTGTNNIALGTNAGSLTALGSNNIYIGNQGINGSESKVMRIGKVQTATFIAGIAGKALSGASVVVNANGQLGVVASSARYKQDIAPLTDASEKLAQLRPVSYRYTAEPGTVHYGLIAEEVDKVMPEILVRDNEGRPESVQYIELIPLLVQQLKRQEDRLARQEVELGNLRRTLAKRFATAKHQL